MSNEQFLNFLGLAMRAGKVKTGEAVVMSELKKSRLKLVLIAGDASDNTKQQWINKCQTYHTPCRIVSSREALGGALGKSARVNIGITEQGFAKKMMALIDE